MLVTRTYLSQEPRYVEEDADMSVVREGKGL